MFLELTKEEVALLLYLILFCPLIANFIIIFYKNQCDISPDGPDASSSYPRMNLDSAGDIEASAQDAVLRDQVCLLII